MQKLGTVLDNMEQHGIEIHDADA